MRSYSKPTEIAEARQDLWIDAELESRGLLGTKASPVWEPLPGPQTAALNSQADELYFGGAAGGGKTDLLLGAAMTQHRAAIVFRRQFRQLQGAEGLVERSRTLLQGTGAKYNGQQMLWRDVPGDRKLEFGAAQREEDVWKYQGQPHDLVAFDELPHFTETQYRNLAGWNRTALRNQRCRIIAAGNPPLAADGAWVVKYWGAWLDPTHKNPAMPGELRWYAMVGGEEVERPDGQPFVYEGEEITPKSRTFIPAKVTDNPYYMQSGYMSRLQAFPEPMRSKLLYGDFSIGFEDDPWQVIPTAWIIAAQQREGTGSMLTSMGADVSLGNPQGDVTVFAEVYDHRHVMVRQYKEIASDTPTMEIAGMLYPFCEKIPSAVFVDVIGLGTGVVERLAERYANAHPGRQERGVCGFNAASRTDLRDKSGAYGFINWRAAMWWLGRELLDPDNGFNISLPDDRELLADLAAPYYKITSASKIQIEAKESIRRRIGRSTDNADAVLQALIGPVLWAEGQEETRVVYDGQKIW